MPTLKPFTPKPSCKKCRGVNNYIPAVSVVYCTEVFIRDMDGNYRGTIEESESLTCKCNTCGHSWSMQCADAEASNANN